MRQSLRRLSQSRPSLPHHRSSPPFLPSFALVPLLLPDSVVVDHFRLASPCFLRGRFGPFLLSCVRCARALRPEGGREAGDVRFARFLRGNGAGGDGAHQKISLQRERSWPPLSSASPLGPARLPLLPGPVLRVRKYLFRPLPLTHLAFSSSIPPAARPSCPYQKDLAKRENFRNTTTRHDKSAVILSGHMVQVQTCESIRELDTFFSIWPL